MSELTRCNYCSLRAIRAEAARAGATVIVQPATGDMGPDADVDDDLAWLEVRRSDRPEPVAWYAALPDHCAC